MAKEPEESGQPASDGSGTPGDNAVPPAPPGNPQPAETGPAADAASKPADSHSAVPAETQSAEASASTADTPKDTSLPEDGPAVQPTGESTPDPAQEHHNPEEWRDPAYDEYHQHDDPHHYDHHHDPHHDSGSQSHGHEPHGDYYHEPGAYEPSGSASAGGKEEEKSFEGLFGGGDDDGEGGPVKGFLEHLEDLRWVLIKSIVSILVAMVVCLVATPLIVAILKRPVDHPLVIGDGNRPPTVRLQLGTNQMEVALAGGQFGPFTVASNTVATFDLVPVLVDTNLVMALRSNPSAPTNATPRKPMINIRGVTMAFSIAIQIALWGGLGLASPFVIFFLGQFLVPALKRKERDYVFKGAAIGAGLFFGGVAFCYFILLPIGVMATVQFANWMGFAAEIWDAGEYISFCVMFMVGMGLCFELPVVLLTLVKIGILNHRLLSKFRPFWLILNLVICGFVTPSGDPLSMFLMALPIHLLYEISVLIARYWAWQDRKREAREAAGE